MKRDCGSKYFSVATPAKSFITDAGLRCEYEFLSYTTSPVVPSIKIIAGLERTRALKSSSNAAGMDAADSAAFAGVTDRATTTARREIPNLLRTVNPC